MRYNKPFSLVYVEDLSNENNLNLGYINHSLLQLGHTGNHRFDHVVYLDLYEYEGTVHLINHTQAESLFPLYDCILLHLDKRMKKDLEVEMQLYLGCEYPPGSFMRCNNWRLNLISSK